MDSQTKLALINELNLANFVQGIEISQLDQYTSDLLPEFCKLINALGIQLVQSKDLQGTQALLPKAIQCMHKEEPEISQICFDFLTVYAMSLKNKKHQQPPEVITQEEINNLGTIILGLMQRCQLSSDFSHVGPENSEEEDQFYKFREELAHLFKRLVDIPALFEPVLQQISTLLMEVIQNQSSFTVEQVESRLFLFLQISESVRKLGLVMVQDNLLSQTYRALLESNIKYLNHRIILPKFFQIGVRYSAFFQTNTNSSLILLLVNSMVTNIQNQDLVIKTSAISAFNQLTSKSAQILAGFSDTILESISQVIDPQEESENKSLIYKSIGLIISQQNVPKEKQSQYLNYFLGPLLSNLNEYNLSLVAYVLQGFKQKMPEEQASTILQLATNIYNSIASIQLTEQIIEPMIRFVTGLITCLGDNGFQIIQQYCLKFFEGINRDNIGKIMSLQCHIANMLQNSQTILVNGDIINKTINIVLQNIPQPQESISDISQQNIEIRRSFGQYIQTLLLKNIDFLTQENFEPMLQYLKSIAVNIIEGSSQKLGISCLHKILKKLLSLQVSMPQFQPAILAANEAAETIFKDPRLHPESPDVKDVLKSISEIHVTIALYLSQDNSHLQYIQYIGNLIPADMLQKYSELIFDCLQLVANGDKSSKYGANTKAMSFILKDAITINRIS